MTHNWAAPAVAAVAWVGAWVGWLWPAFPAPVAVVVVVVAAATLSSRVARPLAAVVVAASCVAGLGATARQVPASLAGRTVSFEARITGPPRQVAVDLGAPPAVSIPVTVNRLQVGTTVWHVDLPGRAFADASDIPGVVVPGVQLTARARVLPQSPEDTSARLQLLTVEHIVADPGPVAATVEKLRSGLSTATATGSPEAAALVAGIALGDESGQSPQLARTMQVSGLSHLTAVSGGNFVVVMGVVLLLARWGRTPLPGQVVLAAGALIGYAVVVGPQPSVLRAATMAGAGLVGVLLGGRSRGLAVLSGCVTALLLVSPDLARSLGFALSVAATAGLQLLAAPSGRVLGRVMPGRLALAVAVTVVAHAATTPLLVMVGAPVSWVAVPANLLVAPLVGAITVLGVVAAVIGAVSGTAAALAGVPAVALAQLIVGVAQSAQIVATAPWGVRVGQGMALALAAGAGIAWGATRWGARVRLPLIGLVAVTCIAVMRVSGPTGDWRIVVCDVGQGTAVLANTDVGPVLFDAGPASGDVSGCLARAGVTDLVATVVSHYHSDHVAGLPELLVARHTGQVLGPSGAAPSATGQAVAQLVQAGAVASDEVAATDRWQWGGVSATALWPPAGRRFPVDEANNGSLVIVLEWPDGLRLLLPGDVEPESQAQIMRAWAAGPMDVVVMPHHGSDHQDPGFAAWAQPTLAVASAGAANSYGHPAAGTLSEYEAAGAVVRRTDLDGSVVVGVRDGELVVGSQ